MKKIQIRLKSPIVSRELLDQKKCNKCDQIKPTTEYYKCYGTCKECVKASQRERNKRDKEKQIAIKQDPIAKLQPKICSNCGQEKTVNDFRINRGECLDCERKYGREYNQTHREIRRTWWENNLDRAHQLQATWYQNNKVHVLTKYYERYHNDPAYRIGLLNKRRLQSAVKREVNHKDYFGVSVDFVKKWLEYNFTDQMNWGNHGTYWEIDHVIPINWFDFTQQSEIDLCFGWKNLSPLVSPDNLRKSDSVVFEQLETHITKLKEFVQREQLDENLDLFLEQYKQKLNSTQLSGQDTLMRETP